MFSIIIPLYNKENTIENTVNSVLNQSFKVLCLSRNKPNIKDTNLTFLKVDLSNKSNLRVFSWNPKMTESIEMPGIKSSFPLTSNCLRLAGSAWALDMG